MKLRLVPVLVSVAVTAAVTFGGWFIYRSAALESPLAELLREADGVTDASVEITSDTVIVQLKLEPDARLRDIMRLLREEGERAIGDREVRVKIVNNASGELEDWWAASLFDVAEAMENRQYGKIPETLRQRASELPGLQVDAAMDEENVYVRLVRGDDSKFVILPRTPSPIGVWPNE